MANDVNITSISQQSLQQLGQTIAQSLGSGSAAAGSSSAAQQAKAVQGNVRAVKQSNKAYETLKKKVKGFGDGIDDFLGSIKGVIDSKFVQRTLEEFKTGVKGGAEAVDGFTGYLERQKQAYYDLGITVDELHNFNKTARAASINLGGFNEWTGKLTEKQSHYFARIGDLTAAAEHQAVMMEELTHAGAQAADLYGPFGKRLDNINDDLLKLGVSYEESREIFKDYMDDEDVRHRLRGAADEKQRKQILLEIQGRIKHFKTLGMTTEQAKKASQALEQLGGKKPLDRFKQAAKAQAALSAMGIEGASEIGNIIRKGNRATEEERERMQEVFGEAQDIAADAAQGPMAQEFFVRGLIEKTGLEDMMGKDGVFSTKLDKGAKVSNEQLKAINMIGQDTPKITKVVEVMDKVNNAITNNPFIAGSWKFLGKIWDVVKFLPMLLTPVASGIATIAAAAAPWAAGALALFGVYEGVKALVTGTSDIWNWINNFFPNFAKHLSNALGYMVDSLLSKMGSVWGMGDIAEAAQKRLDLSADAEARELTAQRERETQSNAQIDLAKSQQSSADAMTQLANSLQGNISGIGGTNSANSDIMEQFEKTNSLLAKIAGLNEDQLSTMGIEPAPLSNQ